MAKKKEQATSSLNTEAPQAATGIACKYVRFRDPVPAKINAEPVYEFYTRSTVNKYVVDSIDYLVQDGIFVFKAYGETGYVPDGNVVFAREA